MGSRDLGWFGVQGLGISGFGVEFGTSGGQGTGGHYP